MKKKGRKKERRDRKVEGKKDRKKETCTSESFTVMCLPVTQATEVNCLSMCVFCPLHSGDRSNK